MQAKVKQEYRYGNAMLALGRHEFLKSEWRSVPIGSEAEAEAHEWLDTRPDPEVEELETETPTADAILAEAVEEIQPDQTDDEIGNVSEASSENEPADDEPVEQEVEKKNKRYSRKGKTE